MPDNIEHSEVQTDLRHFPSQDPPHVSSAATSHGNPEDEFIAKIAVRYSVSKEAVAMVLNGLKATGGRRVESITLILEGYAIGCPPGLWWKTW